MQVAVANKPIMAAVAILTGMFVLGLSDNFLQIISPDVGLAQFHLFRSAIALALLTGVAWFTGASLWPIRPAWVLARSLFTAGAMVIYFGCLALMPIGIVVAGLFTSPIFVLGITAMIQRRRVGPWRILAVLIGFAGTLLVIQPDPGAIEPLRLLPVLGGLLYAIGAVATRAWCEGESTFALSAGFFAMLFAMGVAALTAIAASGHVAPPGADGFPLRAWVPLTGVVMFWIAIQALSALVGISLIFRGYQMGEASHVAVFEYSLLVFASIWAFVLWDQVVGPTALTGMTLIAVSGTIIAWRSGRDSR
jgi:drug/metabolite transporter (DMT)-like permease